MSLETWIHSLKQNNPPADSAPKQEEGLIYQAGLFELMGREVATGGKSYLPRELKIYEDHFSFTVTISSPDPSRPTGYAMKDVTVADHYSPAERFVPVSLAGVPFRLDLEEHLLLK